MNTVQVGLVGYGFSGAVFHAPILSVVDALHLKTIVSSNPQKVHHDYPDVAVVAAVEDVLGDPEIDLIVIATPNETHYALAKQALQAGKHVVVEKPLVNHLAEADELLQLAHDQQRLLSVYHNRRWDNDFLTVKQCLETGLLGQIFTYEAHYDRYRPQVGDRWREQPLAGSGILYDLGAHLIDQALHLFGLPQTVFADLALQRSGSRAVDYFHLILGYGTLRVLLHGGSLVREPGYHFAVHGDRGSFIKHGMDPQEAALIQGQKPDRPGWGQEPETQYGLLVTEVDGLTLRSQVETLPGCYPAFYQRMAEAILYGANPPVAAPEARQVIAVVESAIRSSETQHVISFSL